MEKGAVMRAWGPLGKYRQVMGLSPEKFPQAHEFAWNFKELKLLRRYSGVVT